MYSPDEQGEYGTATAVSSFTVQGLSDALMALDLQVTEVTKMPRPLGLSLCMQDGGSLNATWNSA